MFAASEELELLRHGFVKCYFVQLYCPHCGTLRQAVRFPPDEYIACPRCARTHCNCGVLGSGYTRRELPQWECWATPLDKAKLNRIVEDDEPVRQVIRAVRITPSVPPDPPDPEIVEALAVVARVFGITTAAAARIGIWAKVLPDAAGI